VRFTWGIFGNDPLANYEKSSQQPQQPIQQPYGTSKTSHQTPLRSSAFEALEKDFQEVLQDRSMQFLDVSPYFPFIEIASELFKK
jgi:hypothetical protein